MICSLHPFPVGYDDRKMILDGTFSYDSENQRALPFTVKITELSEEMKIFSGSSSKLIYPFWPIYFNFTVLLLLLFCPNVAFGLCGFNQL